MDKVKNKKTKKATLTKSGEKRIQYVMPVGNGWVVKSSYKAKFTVLSDNKREAITIARKIAKETRTELIVFARDGRITIQANYAP